MESLSPIEHDLRMRIIRIVEDQMVRNGGTVTREELSALNVDGTVRRAIDHTKGIWNPSDLEATLSIVSTPRGPYSDEDMGDGFFRYSYQKGSAEGNNTKLRRAMETGAPLILLRWVDRGVYVPILPVYVIADDRPNRQFVIALDESLRYLRDPLHASDDQRRYALAVSRRRLHQPEFRAKVIRAYTDHCAICALHHRELLDAAHIAPDTEIWGYPVVSNGLSLCKLHHAAFDQNLIGINPDYEVRVNRDLLEEQDGPMLKYGIQGMHGRRIQIPVRIKDRPDKERLAIRYEMFVATA